MLPGYKLFEEGYGFESIEHQSTSQFGSGSLGFVSICFCVSILVRCIEPEIRLCCNVHVDGRCETILYNLWRTFIRCFNLIYSTYVRYNAQTSYIYYTVDDIILIIRKLEREKTKEFVIKLKSGWLLESVRTQTERGHEIIKKTLTSLDAVGLQWLPVNFSLHKYYFI